MQELLHEESQGVTFLVKENFPAQDKFSAAQQCPVFEQIMIKKNIKIT